METPLELNKPVIQTQCICSKLISVQFSIEIIDETFYKRLYAMNLLFELLEFVQVQWRFHANLSFISVDL